MRDVVQVRDDRYAVAEARCCPEHVHLQAIGMQQRRPGVADRPGQLAGAACALVRGVQQVARTGRPVHRRHRAEVDEPQRQPALPGDLRKLAFAGNGERRPDRRIGEQVQQHALGAALQAGDRRGEQH